MHNKSIRNCVEDDDLFSLGGNFCQMLIVGGCLSNKSDRDLSAWTSAQLISQIAFLLFAAATACIAWTGADKRR